MEAKLIAIYPILYESKQYKVGERLPANNHEMIDAWLLAGTAKWEGLDNTSIEKETLNDEESSKVQSLGDIDKKDDEEINKSESNNKNSEEDNNDEDKEKEALNDEESSKVQSLGDIDKKDDEEINKSESNSKNPEEDDNKITEEGILEIEKTKSKKK